MAEVQEITIRDTAAQAQTAAQSLPPTEDLQDMPGEKMVLNMGPSHPSTHGVLRIILELDGEIITKAIPDVGYLHRGDEKIAENMTYTQFIPYTDRLDYLAPLANNVAYFTTHQEHMNYPEYRRRGWPIGSGETEAAVKQFNKRVKGTEQFWSAAGVEAILALRGLWLSQDSRWERYWENRPAHVN